MVLDIRLTESRPNILRVYLGEESEEKTGGSKFFLDLNAI